MPCRFPGIRPALTATRRGNGAPHGGLQQPSPAPVKKFRLNAARPQAPIHARFFPHTGIARQRRTASARYPDGTQGPRRAPGILQHLHSPAGSLADRSGSPAYCVRIGHGHSCINWFPLICLRFSLVLNCKIRLVYTSSIFNRSRPFISIYSG